MKNIEQLSMLSKEWDIMPAGRIKTFHSIGAVCPIQINIKKSPFTGLFKPGVINGLMRLGPGLDFT